MKYYILHSIQARKDVKNKNLSITKMKISIQDKNATEDERIVECQY